MTDDDRYLFVVEYESDAERKRAEYLFDNVAGDVETVEGLARFASDVDGEAIYEELVSKVPEDQVSAYRLDSMDVDAESETATVVETVGTDPEAVEGFVEYMLSKKKAVLQSPDHDRYEVYTKKGRAEVTYDLSESGDGTDVVIRVEGYPPAPEFLADFFRTELNDYARSQS